MESNSQQPKTRLQQIKKNPELMTRAEKALIQALMNQKKTQNKI